MRGSVRRTCSRAPLQRGEAAHEGGGGLPQREEREYVGYGDSSKEQRGVGAQTLPHDERPPRSRETKPTTFETLTSGKPCSKAVVNEVSPSSPAALALEQVLILLPIGHGGTF